MASRDHAGETVKMSRGEWTLGQVIGGGGFGAVYEARSATGTGVVKLVQKEPGADRELLFTPLAGRPNVVPVLDVGEIHEYWALAMPRADRSLRERLLEAQGPLPLPEVVEILTDIATAITGMKGEVVHRDLKPENVLFLKGHWCLADFGIARYSDATTSQHTRKFVWTPPYAAPEQWLEVRVTPATDIYALGVIAFELSTGTRPFHGPALREQHLFGKLPHADRIPAKLAPLIADCLNKAPAARPTPASLLKRLQRIGATDIAPGLAVLQEANNAESGRRFERERMRSMALSDEEANASLFRAAEEGFTRITDVVREALIAAAPAAQEGLGTDASWSLELADARISLDAVSPVVSNPWRPAKPPAFGVVAHARIHLIGVSTLGEVVARSHSLWYGDAQQAQVYEWFETAFAYKPELRPRTPEVVFALPPGEESGVVLSGRHRYFQLAWPFTPLRPEDLDDFVNRWAEWFGMAAQGGLVPPDVLAQRDPAGSYRQ